MTIRIGNSILSTSAPIFSDISNRDLSNLTEVGEKHFLNKSQITNCLLEVPQRVKLELNDGILTLKAGSQVIVPNGFEEDGVTPKFDYVTIESDVEIILSTIANVACLCVYDGSTNTVRANAYSNYSGDGSDTPNGWYYNTTTNKIYYINGSGDVTRTNCSFPIAIINYDSNIVPQIKQIFNGMGYIGSIRWVDKGITALSGQGKNFDGSINNSNYTTSKVKLYDNSSWDALTVAHSGYLLWIKSSVYNILWFQPYDRFLTSKSQATNASTLYFYFDKQEAQWYLRHPNTTDWEKGEVYIYADMTTKGGDFKSKQPFRAVDYNDLDTKVNKTGDTMTGSLTIDMPNNSTLNVKSSSIAYTEVPSSSAPFGQFAIFDKNSEWIALFGTEKYTDGRNLAKMQVKGIDDSWARIDIVVEEDGTSYATAPTPPTNDNSTKIATTGWVTGNVYPDYSKGYSRSVDTEYTVMNNGMLMINAILGSTLIVTINGKALGYSPNTNNQDDRNAFYFLLKKGDKFKFSGITGYQAVFYPVA